MRSEDTVLVSFSLAEIAAIKATITDKAPFAERISTGLALRLACHPGEAPAVLRTINALEGVGPEFSRKQRPAPFKHLPLYPYWHAHFINSRHALRNVGDRWGISRGGKGNKQLDGAITDIAEKYGHVPNGWQGAFAQRLMIGGLMGRANSQTLSGDWVIFGKHEGNNYYLDIAEHEEGQGDRAIQLAAKLRASSAADFPFLF